MKFSFIIIANNQINTICKMIDSIVNQTYRDLEVIYVDDASTDGSADFVEKKYASDARVKVLRHTESRGCVVSRMDGVDEATGDWVLLGDGDDYYAPDTCQVLFDAISNATEPIDMIGFGVEVVCLDDSNIPNIEELEGVFGETKHVVLSGTELVDTIFLERKKSWNVWNKCYSIEIIKHMAATATREKLITSEDAYLNFIGLNKVNTYIGIPNRLYYYSFGLGISTMKKLPLPAFERYLLGDRCHSLIKEYAKENGLYDKYKDLFFKLDSDFIWSCYNKITLLSGEDKLLGTQKFFEIVGVKKILSFLSCNLRDAVHEIAKHIDIKRVFPVRKKEIKTIAMLYHRMYNGGVERVIQLLTPILQAAGYNIVIITNEDENELDYPIPEGTSRVVLGVTDYDIKEGEGYGARYDKFLKCIEEYNIDLVLYHAWVADELFWDMATIKSAGIPCIVHGHGSFLSGLNVGWMHCLNSASIYQYADAMITLSEVDRYYWSAVNQNVYCVNNPLTFRPSEVPCSEQNNHNVVWAGRFDPKGKNPFDVLHILSKVVKCVPDVKLYMVGTGDETVVEEMQELADQLELNDNVIFTGYSQDVSSYLQKSSVYLFTSDTEGYSMAFAEALSHGLPIVTYPLPYMTMAKDSKAVIQVGWKDIEGAANALIELLQNDAQRREMSKIAREEAISYQDEDYAAMWKTIFSSIETGEINDVFELDKRTLDAYSKTVTLGFKQMAQDFGNYPSRYSEWELQKNAMQWEIDHKTGEVETLIKEVNALLEKQSIQSSDRSLNISYAGMSRMKRWIAYALFDRARLKAIVKDKFRNHPILLKGLSGFYRSLKKLFKRV